MLSSFHFCKFGPENSKNRARFENDFLKGEYMKPQNILFGLKNFAKFFFLILCFIRCGQAGAPGSSCSVKAINSPTSGSLISCTDGTSSFIVAGTVITPVKFCSQTASYSTTFPEYGFCLGNNLYAVYSYADGFFTLVPPGVYHSNAVGSVCNFTVFPNCVTQEN